MQNFVPKLWRKKTQQLGGKSLAFATVKARNAGFEVNGYYYLGLRIKQTGNPRFRGITHF